jgi:hypothetical protein
MRVVMLIITPRINNFRRIVSPVILINFVGLQKTEEAGNEF